MAAVSLFDPFGRMLVEAPEDEEIAMVAEIDDRQDYYSYFLSGTDAPIPQRTDKSAC